MDDSGFPRRLLGSTLEIEVTDMALDGDALGRLGGDHAGRGQGYVVFVPGAIPGERVRAKIIAAGRKSARATIAAVVSPSPHRVRPRCRHFGPCGGCAWQHIAYAEQLRLKTRMLAALLQRALGERAPEVQPAAGIAPAGEAGAGAPWGFRNKTHFAIGPGRGGGGLAMGHYERGSRRLLEVEECPVHSQEGNRIAFQVRDSLRRHGVAGVEEGRGGRLRGVARHLVVRTGEATGQTQATLVVAREESRALRAVLREVGSGPGAPGGLHLNVHDRPGSLLFGSRTRRVRGEARLRDVVAGATLAISPKSFFQTSARAAETLVGVVLSLLPRSERRPILDLYAGVGLFSIPLARRGHQVIAVEENPTAVADGLASLELNALHSGACRFLRARVEEALDELVEPPGTADRGHRAAPPFGAAILDPPREGCPSRVWTALLRGWRLERVIYVSCNPRALAGDLVLAGRAGYRAVQVQPVDMFPHTAHIEAVALLMPEERCRSPE